MMPARSLVRMVLANTLRSRRHFILSAFGIVIGIGAFVLFLALTQKAGHVLEAVFPLDEVTVEAPRVSMFGKDASTRIDDAIVQKIAGRPEASRVLPRMNLAFPAAGRGEFEGADLRFELAGFADGVDPSYVDDDERIRELFKDWDAVKDDPNRVACVPPGRDPNDDIRQSPSKPPAKPAPRSRGWGNDPEPSNGAGATPAPGSGASGDTGSGSVGSGSVGSGSVGSGSVGSGSVGSGTTGSGSAGSGSAGSGAGSSSVAAGAGSGTLPSAAPPPLLPAAPPGPYYNPCPNPDRYYCDDTERICKHRVPVVLSATVVELYNSGFAQSHRMPMADKNLVNSLIQLRGLSAMRFSIGLGSTTLAGTSVGVKARPRRVEAVVVGVSQRAMMVGVTMPIQYITRWNQEYMGKEAASAYSSVVVKLEDKNRIAVFGQWVADALGLQLKDSLGEKFATVIFVIRLLFLIISVAILVIAVINIGHNFFIQVSERRREIGIMRAVGAGATDVQLIVLGEAAVIGIVGGLLGIGLAVGIGAIWNAYAASGIPNFPLKPSSWFEFKTWILASALGFSTLFCILGGYLPARRAAQMEPAQALTQN
ncbi:MAG: ABC transporter permease [Kofleriaceae bacterium]